MGDAPPGHVAIQPVRAHGFKAYGAFTVGAVDEFVFSRVEAGVQPVGRAGGTEDDDIPGLQTMTRYLGTDLGLSDCPARHDNSVLLICPKYKTGTVKSLLGAVTPKAVRTAYLRLSAFDRLLGDGGAHPPDGICRTIDPLGAAAGQPQTQKRGQQEYDDMTAGSITLHN